jgi:hypothetical protein
MRPFLMQIASEGVTIFANGKPEPNYKNLTIANLSKFGQSSSERMRQAIDWAEKASKTSKWSHLDLTRIAAGGQSCGGTEHRL